VNKKKRKRNLCVSPEWADTFGRCNLSTTNFYRSIRPSLNSAMHHLCIVLLVCYGETKIYTCMCTHAYMYMDTRMPEKCAYTYPRLGCASHNAKRSIPLLGALGPLGAIILVIVAKYRQRITGDSAALFIAGSSPRIYRNMRSREYCHMQIRWGLHSRGASIKRTAAYKLNIEKNAAYP